VPRLNLIDRLTVLLTGQVPTSRASGGAVAARNAYEAGANVRRTSGWWAPSASPNRTLLGSLTTMRDRARAATRNDGYARGAVDRLVTNIVGTGIKPLSMAEDETFRRQVQALWLRWTDQSDADGLLDWYGQQSQAVRAWQEGGEVFLRLRRRYPSDRLSVPMQVQVLEPELCPHDYTLMGYGPRSVRAGIEFDSIGRRRAYWFYRARPGEWPDEPRGDRVRVDADDVIHLFDPRRPGQIRGEPRLAPALVRLHELDKFDDATLMRQQMANMFAAFVTRPPQIDDELTDPLTGLKMSSSSDRQSLALEPATVQELAPGEGIDFAKPPDAGSNYPDYIRQQLFAVSAAVGVPYEVLTGDMRGVNDRTVRVILQEFRRSVQALQHQIVAFQLCRRVWNAWMDVVFTTRSLPIPAAYADDPAPWLAAKWIPQGWPYIQPVQDIEAQTAAIRSGLTSRSASVSEQGEDAEQIDAEQKADNDRADRLGLVYDSDGRTKKTTAPAPPAPTDGGSEDGAAGDGGADGQRAKEAA
jgi:lambda family phage portal protein